MPHRVTTGLLQRNEKETMPHLEGRRHSSVDTIEGEENAFHAFFRQFEKVIKKSWNESYKSHFH
jgi:hypothetical protein